MHRRNFISLLSGGVAAVAAAVGLRSLPKSRGPYFVDTGWVCVDGDRVTSSDTMSFNGGDPSNPPRPIPMAEWRNYMVNYTDTTPEYLLNKMRQIAKTTKFHPPLYEAKFRDAQVDLSRLFNA